MIGKWFKKKCRDQENAILVLYHNICDIGHKYKVQKSYKINKILGMLLLAAGFIQNAYNGTNR